MQVRQKCGGSLNGCYENLANQQCLDECGYIMPEFFANK